MSYLTPTRFGYGLNILHSTTILPRMHPCLTIVEVQYTIFRQAHLDCGALAAGRDNATLARLACTCRTFSDTALKILWEDLDSITCLIRCLPGSLWETRTENHGISFGSLQVRRKYISFQRTMTPNDWAIFHRYASRVRSLSDFGDNIDMLLTLGSDIVLALSRPPFNGPLIPYLKVLSWTGEKEYAPLLPVLFTPTLVDVTLPQMRSPEVPFQLTSTCPSLENLCVSFDTAFASRDTYNQKTLSETVMRLRWLKSLECHTLDEAAILYLSHLPSFTKLTLDLQDQLDLETLRRGLIHPAFASLQSLTLRVHMLSTLTSLLEVMHFKPRQVSFLIMEDVPTPGQLHSFVNALVNACDSMQLSAITLDAGSFYDFVPNVHRAQVSLSTFRPLLAFQNLDCFEFEVMYDILLDDEAIRMLADAWPKITHLSLNPIFGWGIGSRVTHRGLVALFSRCAELDYLALAVDFTEIDQPLSGVPTSYGITNPCRRAHFTTSPIHHRPTIAAFLKDVCPGLSW